MSLQLIEPGDSYEIQRRKYNSNLVYLLTLFDRARRNIDAGLIRGPHGLQGVQGPQGQSTGFEGTQGSQGAQGAVGVQGASGIQTGPPGPGGNLGATGARGPQGAVGGTGAQGPRGPQGSSGLAGAQGVQGALGFQGTQGAGGTQGAQGFQGEAGVPGFDFDAVSSSSIAIGIGTKSFTVGGGLAYTMSHRARVASNASPTTHWMEGPVTSYSSGVLTVTVDRILGSGTRADWNVGLAIRVGWVRPDRR